MVVYNSAKYERSSFNGSWTIEFLLLYTNRPFVTYTVGVAEILMTVRVLFIIATKIPSINIVSLTVSKLQPLEFPHFGLFFALHFRAHAHKTGSWIPIFTPNELIRAVMDPNNCAKFG